MVHIKSCSVRELGSGIRGRLGIPFSRGSRNKQVTLTLSSRAPPSQEKSHAGGFMWIGTLCFAQALFSGRGHHLRQTSSLSCLSSYPTPTCRFPPVAMSGKRDDPAQDMGIPSTPEASNVLAFLRVVGKLKNLKRTGWVHRGVSLPESVSDHMYRMAAASFMITDPTLDRSRIMKLAIVHDLAEALAGDIAPFQKVPKEDKRRMEEEALDTICSKIGGDPVGHAIGEEIKGLWKEYENCSSGEASVAKDLDKFEMIVQADEYEQGQGMDLSEFFESTQGRFTTPQVQSWDKQLRTERDKRRQQATDASESA
ncbi:unnamed protein product [Discosporangium mesarthrocarpum]